MHCAAPLQSSEVVEDLKAGNDVVLPKHAVMAIKGACGALNVNAPL